MKIDNRPIISNTNMHEQIKKQILNILLEEKKKEYLCHIQYVVKIALELAKECDVNMNLIEIACLLHDIWRGKELTNEHHAEAGKRIANDILKESNFSKKEKKIILACILNHNSSNVPKSIEEQIIRTADGGSKIEYHEAFILMCKKTTYEERLAWTLKYLYKGLASISIDHYRKKIEKKYKELENIYNDINNRI